MTIRRLFLLQGMHCQASIGIYDVERQATQTVLIDAELLMREDTEPQNDSIDTTINYDVIRDTIRSLVGLKHYDLQETLEIGAEALRETNDALSAPWKLEAYTPEDQDLERELKEFLSCQEDNSPPSGPDSQSLPATEDSPMKLSEEKTPAWERTRPKTTEELSLPAPSSRQIRNTEKEKPPSSTSAPTVLKQQEKPSLLAS